MTEMYRGTERGFQIPRDPQRSLDPRAPPHAQTPRGQDAHQATNKRTVQSQPELGFRPGNERRVSSVGEGLVADAGK